MIAPFNPRANGVVPRRSPMRLAALEAFA